ncbi:MAG: MBL fold metallo-hydrolase [Terriglobales bacterium]
MHLSFHGAAGDVTGSCHLLEACGRHILIDCGMFQGSRRLAEENADDFGFDPAAVDCLLLTHAHLDHCGRIPLLVKRGFRGQIFSTAATRELAALVLQDAAGLQQEEAERHHTEPLYGPEEVAVAAQQFQGGLQYGATVELAPGLSVSCQDAGHILGSASIIIEAMEGGSRQRLVFSGDLGPGQAATAADKPILNPPAPAPAADVIVMESTYGDRNHRSHADSIAEFRAAIRATLAGGGNVVIPTFALERAQDLLCYLRDMLEAGELAPATPVYLDSPMAISATEIFERHRESVKPALARELAAGKDPFALPGLQMTRTRQQSVGINSARGAIIMAGSGMATGGRILHHLLHHLGDARNAVVFVGYAAQGTPARLIIDGAKSVSILGEPVTVRAAVHTIGGFSAHAGHDELVAWAAGGGKACQIYLVHGEPPAAQALAAALGQQGLKAAIPALGDRVELGAGLSAAKAEAARP